MGRWGATLTASGGTSALRGFDAPWSVGAAVTHLGGRALWGLDIGFGLTETAPDLRARISWRVPLTGP